MKVAIMGVGKPSQVIKKLIDQDYNFWLEHRLGKKIDVAGFVDFQSRGGG